MRTAAAIVTVAIVVWSAIIDMDDSKALRFGLLDGCSSTIGGIVVDVRLPESGRIARNEHSAEHTRLPTHLRKVKAL